MRDALSEAAEEASRIAAVEADLGTLEEMRAALEDIKPIGKYAEAEIEQIFADIKAKTIDNCGKLYPHVTPDLAPSRLHLNRGRDKTVEVYLAGEGFEVPGQHVANAGLSRAVALAFYFALLERHPGGLAFVIMDDPILSLDEDHREAWAANILRPALGTTQIIVATHQRQFLINCRADFQPGRLVELNPRRRSRQITWRPGDRLDRAERLLATAWNSAPNEMRKYREDLLITLDAYGPMAFFNPSNFRSSLDCYVGLQPPNPLAGVNQDKIGRRLRDEKVSRVLDPGSHALTEADVTEPMVADCLRELRELDQTFHNELDRLEALRLRALRSRVLSSPGAPAPATEPLPRLHIGDEAATWNDPIVLSVIGRAAAQTHGCVVDLSEAPWNTSLPPGGAVFVAGETLAPIARLGQWALLAEMAAELSDGDLAAVFDRAGNRFLRRVWSAGDVWLLEAVNPLANVPPASVRKCECVVRKVSGVSYGPQRDSTRGSGRLIHEWLPRQDFPPTQLIGCLGIKVAGTSLEPIAADRQFVLVGRKIEGRFDAVRKGGLFVVETDDDRVGNVIKRVFPHERHWLLVSPNPIEPRDPIPLAKNKIRAVWPVGGVLFNVVDLESDSTA